MSENLNSLLSSNSLPNDIFEGVNQNATEFMLSNRKKPGLTAITYFENKISDDELKSTLYLYANRLKSFGLQKGDKITVVMPNVPEMVYYKYAAWLLGVEVNLVDPRFNPDGILSLVNSTSSILTICELTTYKKKIMPIINKIRSENIVIVSVTDAMKKKFGGEILQNLATLYSGFTEMMLNIIDKEFGNGRVILNRDFIKSNGLSSPIIGVYEDNLTSSVMYTSGSTGKPKGIITTQRKYNIKERQIRYGLPSLQEGESFLAVIPFFSGYGSVAGMHAALCRGLNLYMFPKFNFNDFSRLVYKYRINDGIGTPGYWRSVVTNYARYSKLYGVNDVSFLKNPISGGDIYPAQARREFRDFCNNYGAKGIEMTIGYGSTEDAGPTMTTNNKSPNHDDDYSGILFPGISAAYRNLVTGEITRDHTNEPAELLINDPGIMVGYTDPDATARAFVDYQGEQFYRTGDLFTTSHDNYYFKGRVNRLIMDPGSHTVPAPPIEEVLLTHQAIEECCVVGIHLGTSDDPRGDIPTAFVVLKDGFTSGSEAAQLLHEFAIKHLSERNTAHAYVFVDQLPKMETGLRKVDIQKLENIPISQLDMYWTITKFKPKGKLLNPISKKQ